MGLVLRAEECDPTGKGKACCNTPRHTKTCGLGVQKLGIYCAPLAFDAVPLLRPFRRSYSYHYYHYYHYYYYCYYYYYDYYYYYCC